MKAPRLTILLAEPNPAHREQARLLLKKHRSVAGITEVSSAEEALFSLMDTNPDLVLSEIKFPGKSGIELAELLKKNNIQKKIIFVSDDRSDALPAIRNEVYDFLVKPLDKEQIHGVINRHIELITEEKKEDNNSATPENSDGIVFRFNSRFNIVLTDPNDIVYCKAEGSYTDIYLANGKIETSNNNLAKIEESLLNFSFFRISRGILINLNLLRKVNRSANQCVLLSRGKEYILPGSKVLIRALSKLEFD